MGASWKAAAVSVVGTRHLEQGRDCSDASYAHWDEARETLLLCAADGAGEAELASAGSARAVETISRLAPELLERNRAALVDPERLDQILIELARAARTGLEDEAASDRAEPGAAGDERADSGSLHRYAATLLIALVTPRHLATLQIGDGFIVVTTKPPRMEVVFRPSKGEFANQTCFLTSFDSFDELLALRQVQSHVRPSAGVCAVALITDGLEHVAMDMRAGGTPHPPFFLDLLGRLLELEPTEYIRRLEGSLLDNERIRARTDDDKTLVLAVDSRNPPDLEPGHYSGFASGAPESTGGGGGPILRREPPAPKEIDLSTEIEEDAGSGSAAAAAAANDALPLAGATRPAASAASANGNSFLRGFLAALALVSVLFGVYLFVPLTRVWLAQIVTVAPQPAAGATTPQPSGTGERAATPGAARAGQAADASEEGLLLSTTAEIVLELCLAVTASQIEAGRARPDSDLGLLTAQFDPGYLPAEGPVCLPHSGSAFREDAVRIGLVGRTIDGGNDVRLDPDDQLLATEILPDRRIYTYAMPTANDDRSWHYAFDIAFAPDFRYCARGGSPVAVGGDGPDDSRIYLLCR